MCRLVWNARHAAVVQPLLLVLGEGEGEGVRVGELAAGERLGVGERVAPLLGVALGVSEGLAVGLRVGLRVGDALGLAAVASVMKVLPAVHGPEPWVFLASTFTV